MEGKAKTSAGHVIREPGSTVHHALTAEQSRLTINALRELAAEYYSEATALTRRQNPKLEKLIEAKKLNGDTMIAIALILNQQYNDISH